jgi:hypothetical protein
LLARELEKANLPAIFGPNTLVIRFPSIYNQAAEHCQAPSSVTRLEDAIRKVTGRTWNLRFEATPSTAPNAPLPLPGEAEEVPVARQRRDFREEAEKQPLVRRAKEALGGQVIRADEGFGELAVPPTAAGPAEEEEP